MRRVVRIMAVFGTRPEAIKMAPVITALQSDPRFKVCVTVTAQHRSMLDQVLRFTGIEPDIDLDLMEPGQTIDGLAARVLTSLGPVFDSKRPDRVLVHGDTTTTMMASLASYFRRIPLGHVEAGLRSGNIHAPWPEEVNRKVTGTIADLHFAPTRRAADALAAENIAPGTIHVTGNTALDALLGARRALRANPALAPAIGPLVARFQGKRIIGVTAHRRESFGPGLKRIAAALVQLAARGDVAIVYPVHPNPEVASAVEPLLKGVAGITMIEPLDYPNFVAMLEASTLVLTDSGGVQEEAPSLDRPVLVMRETTERGEGIEAGTAQLVGTRTDAIVAAASHLLDDPAAYRAVAEAPNPYGDGQAAQRIVRILARSHGLES